MKRFKVGVVTADTAKELGVNAVKHLGFLTDDDENVGKRVVFKKPECYNHIKLYSIVCCQKVWGYDEKGNYVWGVPGYRLAPVSENGVVEDDFGVPCQAYAITIVDDAFKLPEEWIKAKRKLDKYIYAEDYSAFTKKVMAIINSLPAIQ